MLNSLLNIGKTSLQASQAWINVTGNNIANADTEGYSRQYIDQRDSYAVNYRPGEMGMGVNAQQVLRYYDSFLEQSYIRQNTNSARWDEQDKLMTSLETLFNESNRTGLSSTLNDYFKAWSDLGLYPDSTAHRESLLAYADNLSDMFSNTAEQIKKLQDDMSVSIKAGVDRINEISRAIADLNRQITANTVDGVNNPNSLLDERDQLVRELSELVDVQTIDNGKGNFTVQLSTGQPLVDGTTTYEMAYLKGITQNRLVPGSSYAGEVQYEGTDGFEYTLEILDGANAGDPKQFRVSLDGGKTWLKDEDGQELRIDITDADGDGVSDPVKVKNLTISFTELYQKDDAGNVVDENGDPLTFNPTTGKFEDAAGQAANPAWALDTGNKFDLVPKDALYWIEPTRGPENVTPQVFLDGTDNGDRVTGGKLAAYFNIRDDNCTRYLDELDATAKSLIWEVNRQHSQGAGLQNFDYLMGTESVGDITQPLGSWQSMLTFSDRLEAGSIQFHFYDKTTGDYTMSATLTFNPAYDSLEDVRDKINAFTDADNNQLLKATIQDGKLNITSNNPNQQFAMGEDSSGLMAALGLNTFFSGNSAETLAVNQMLHMNTDWVASGQVNGDHEINVGDPITAQGIGALANKDVVISTVWKTVDNQTISEFYANLVSEVGSERRLSKTNSEYHDTLTQDIFSRSQSVSGVSLDEELTNLIKYQHSYTAAAKLITTADQMLQTLLGIKQ